MSVREDNRSVTRRNLIRHLVVEVGISTAAATVGTVSAFVSLAASVAASVLENRPFHLPVMYVIASGVALVVVLSGFVSAIGYFRRIQARGQDTRTLKRKLVQTTRALLRDSKINPNYRGSGTDG